MNVQARPNPTRLTATPSANHQSQRLVGKAQKPVHRVSRQSPQRLFRSTGRTFLSVVFYRALIETDPCPQPGQEAVSFRQSIQLPERLPIEQPENAGLGGNWEIADPVHDSIKRLESKASNPALGPLPPYGKHDFGAVSPTRY